MDNNELGTNLAEVGTDCISRQAAIDALNEVVKDHSITDFDAIASILDLPPAQPEIIRCRNCKFASGDSRICMKFGHSPIGELDFCSFAEPKRGKWIHHPEIGWGETWLCDQCGEKTTSTVMGKPRANFCPMCGADMRGEQDG